MGLWVVLKVRVFFDRIDNNFGWICADVACVVARCCVRVVFVIQLSWSSQALSWLCTKMIFQDLRVFAIAQLWGVGRPRPTQ
jgi:hypothetical protein